MAPTQGHPSHACLFRAGGITHEEGAERNCQCASVGCVYPVWHSLELANSIKGNTCAFHCHRLNFKK